jgi:uncharacterized protein with GYD domain
MFTYVGLFQLTEQGREHLDQAPTYFEKVTKIIEKEGGEVERVLAIMGPWDFFALMKYPDNETAFRVLAKIAEFEYFKTETFPAEDVAFFVKTFA